MLQISYFTEDTSRRRRFHVDPTEAAYSNEIGVFAILMTLALILVIILPDAEKAYKWLIRNKRR